MGIFDTIKKKISNSISIQQQPKINKQEIVFAKQQAENLLRICNDSAKLISETKKPEVFFSRYALLLQRSKELIDYESIVNFSGASPSQVYQEVVNQKQVAIFEFLKRYWIDTLDRTEKLKTESAKKKRYQEFYDSLAEFKNEMNSDNIDYYETKYKAYMRN